MNFTVQQQSAIAAEGNVLVLAGAGTGKTRTLVERCIQRVLAPINPVSLDEVLMVTFTEAAAAEMRLRIRNRLEEEIQRQPDHPRLSEQLALLETAHIGTLHGFCLELIRQHFYALDLDPQLSVLSPEQSEMLAAETLDAILAGHYEGKSSRNLAVQELIETYRQGWEEPVRELLRHLHRYTQTRPDPSGWFRHQLAALQQDEPVEWRRWLIEGFAVWVQQWIPHLRAQPPENLKAHTCARALESFVPDSPEAMARIIDSIVASDLEWPRGLKGAWRKPIGKFYAETEFWASLLPSPNASDPLKQDWEWIRDSMRTLLELGQEFAQQFAEAKRHAGSLDFHDLEQFALRLLWDLEAGQPSEIARKWRGRFRLVFVDEYQDINAAQDRILTALSRPDPEANRFLVGDVKQSIYRFRQAAPEIFQSYARRWERDPSGCLIPLSDNFRSHESILAFVNAFFGKVMRPSIGGVSYDADAQLRFGQRADGIASTPPREGPRVEVVLQQCGTALDGSEDSPDTADDRDNLSTVEIEARRIAHHLRELRASGHKIWDAHRSGQRPVEWRDIVILLRSPRFKVEIYAKEFARAQVPLEAKRGGLFDSIEVCDLVNLLRILDNPLQDVPVLAVLRSPLAGLALDQLAAIRLTAGKVRFWTALRRFHKISDSKSIPPEATSSLAPLDRAAASAWQKVDTFLRRFDRWRTMGRQSSLSQRLENILEETNYLEWLQTQPRGEQRRLNVQHLLNLARQFDDLHQQGLHRFLRMLDAQEKLGTEQESPSLETGNFVRLMSIHQSKGLEFPIVVLADLGKRFNPTEATAGILLDEQYGLCPQIKPPTTGQRYPSLPYWLARRRRQLDALGEELRILYVALTRAEDTLILVGSASTKALTRWRTDALTFDNPQGLERATSYLHWLGPWLTADAGPDWVYLPNGQRPLWRWKSFSEPRPVNSTGAPSAPDLSPPIDFPTSSEISALIERFRWAYPHQRATTEPAKTSVTALRRQFSAERDSEVASAAFVPQSGFRSRAAPAGRLTSEQTGTVYHRFFELLDLGRIDSLGLENELRRMLERGLILPEEAAALDLEEVRVFWKSELGRRICQNTQWVRREHPFTTRLSAQTFAKLQWSNAVPQGDFVVAQGVIDLAVILPDRMWIVDFKTDRVGPGDLEEKSQIYRPQLEIYSAALEQIYRRPVSERWLHFLRPRLSVAI